MISVEEAREHVRSWKENTGKVLADAALTEIANYIRSAARGGCEGLNFGERQIRYRGDYVVCRLVKPLATLLKDETHAESVLYLIAELEKGGYHVRRLYEDGQNLYVSWGSKPIDPAVGPTDITLTHERCRDLNWLLNKA